MGNNSSMQQTQNKIEIGRNNTYKFIKILGQGTYGQVWLATDLNNNNVAIKIFNQENNDDTYENELLYLNTIKDKCNDYAVCVLDYYQINNKYRIVMNYIKGLTLHEYMFTLKLSERHNNEQIIKDLVIGINELHKLGITHQDIKEANIMWDEEAKKFKYVDWGISCLQKYCKNDQPCESQNCYTSGTEYTMPPELQFGFENYTNTFKDTVAHDIWSVGVVLADWYLATDANYYNASLFNFDQQYIFDYIECIPDDVVKGLLRLLLTVDKKERLENWAGVVDLTNIFI